MGDLLTNIWEYIISNPLMSLLWLLVGYVSVKVTLWVFLNMHRYSASKRQVFMLITMPREDSPKDKDTDVEKDFREKISLMSQFFRNVHETSELNLVNQIRTRVFKDNVFSLEIVSKDKSVEFYISTPRYYQDIIEKQVTSYYPDADIQIGEKYEHTLPGNKVKGYYAYTEMPYWFPIKTFKVIENDPLNDLTNIFSKLTKDETAVIQLVMRPKDRKWSRKAEDLGESYYKGKKTTGIKLPVIGPLLNVFKGIFLGYDKMEQPKQGGDGYVRMLQSKEEIAKRMGEKTTQSGFDVVIRLLSTAKTEERAEEISNSMVVGLSLFKDGSSNWFQTRRIVPIDFINDKLFMFSFEHRMIDTRIFGIGEKKSILAEDEISSIYHLPSSRYNYAPVIKWINYKVLPAPVNAPTTGIVLGHNVYRGEKKEIRFQKSDRSRHQYIVGKSGSGKSALLSYMVRQDIANGEGVCVIDPHGDLIEDILTYIPKERAKDVIIFDPSDQERPMGLNILEGSSSAEQDLVSSQATEIFIKLFGDEIFGPRIQHYFRNACLTLMEDEEEGATLIDIPRIFTDDDFLRRKVKTVKNPVVKSFWKNEYANTGDRERQEMIPYFSSKFGPFITNSIMRNTIGQKNSAFNFREIMDTGKIFLVKLSKGKIGDLNTQLLGLVMVARLQMAAMSRADIPEEERKDFFLYVDEFQNFATDSFCSILSEARKYHLNLVMAHQYINQLVVSKYGTSSTQIRDSVFGNVGTLCSFKVGAEDAEYLAKEYAPLLTEQDVIGISNFKMYMKLNINNATSRAFSVSTIWDTSGQNKKLAEIIREYARLKHGRKREFVEQEITTRIGIDMNSAPVDISTLPGQPNAAPQGGGMPGMPPGMGDMAAMGDMSGVDEIGEDTPPTDDEEASETDDEEVVA